MSDLMEYEHPTDYVVIPIAMRDRLWKRFQKSEARVKKLEAAIKGHREITDCFATIWDDTLYAVLEDKQ